MKYPNIFAYLRKVHVEKEDYKKQMERVRQLPHDYQVVYEEIQKFLWQFVTGDGMYMLPVMIELLEFFEEGVANKIPVMELIGKDPGSFAENLLHELKEQTPMDQLKRKLNRKINKKLKLNL